MPRHHRSFLYASFLTLRYYVSNSFITCSESSSYKYHNIIYGQLRNSQLKQPHIWIALNAINNAPYVCTLSIDIGIQEIQSPSIVLFPFITLLLHYYLFTIRQHFSHILGTISSYSLIPYLPFFRLKFDFFELAGYQSGVCIQDTLTVLGATPSNYSATPICGNMTNWGSEY